jgi:hypothetical protein
MVVTMLKLDTNSLLALYSFPQDKGTFVFITRIHMRHLWRQLCGDAVTTSDVTSPSVRSVIPESCKSHGSILALCSTPPNNKYIYFHPSHWNKHWHTNLLLTSTGVLRRCSGRSSANNKGTDLCGRSVRPITHFYGQTILEMIGTSRYNFMTCTGTPLPLPLLVCVST